MNNIPPYLLQTANEQYESANLRKAKISFLEKTILNSARTLKSIYLQAENATNENFIYKINPHVKLILLIYLAVGISFVNNLSSQILLTTLIFVCYILARLKVYQVYRKIILLSFIFGVIVALPASLNVITPGKIVFKLITFHKASHFWIYNIPQNIGFTENGFHVVSLIFLRILNSISFAMIIVFTTPFPSFIKSFKIIGVPDTFLMIISLAYKYVFILSKTIEETYLAMKSRLICNLKSKNIRNLISGRIFFIFKKSGIIYESTYLAMISRGYDGKVKLYSKYHFTLLDLVSLLIVVVAGLVIILL